MPKGAARCQALRAEATAIQTLAALNCRKADAALTLEAIRSAHAAEQAYVIGWLSWMSSDIDPTRPFWV
jgi:hypothetical protein